jgi:hypothetical protein
MSNTLEGMVVVASGRSVTIKLWSRILRRIPIPYAIAHRHYDDLSAPMDHAEIWVERDDADRARAAIRRSRHEARRLDSDDPLETALAQLETQVVPRYREEPSAASSGN